MIKQENFQYLRSRNWERVLELANAVEACVVPARTCDPIQVWESHPVASQFLDLSDREISAAILVANAQKTL